MLQGDPYEKQWLIYETRSMKYRLYYQLLSEKRISDIMTTPGDSRTMLDGIVLQDVEERRLNVESSRATEQQKSGAWLQSRHIQMISITGMIVCSPTITIL